MKYRSTNIFCNFEFHDAVFYLETFIDGTLILSAKCLNIHKSAEQNTHPTDMEIDEAIITFNNFRVKSYEPGRSWKVNENGESYTDDPLIIYNGAEAEVKLISDLEDGIAVHEFGLMDDCYYIEAGSATEPWFHVEFFFDSATIEWDNYRKMAWYEERNRATT